MSSPQKSERERAATQATTPAPAAPVANRSRWERETGAQIEMGIEVALRNAATLIGHDDCVGNDNHLQGLQQLERAIQLLPVPLRGGLPEKWTQLAADLLRGQASPRARAWNRRQQIRALYREIAEIFEKMRADRVAAAA